MRIRHGWRQSHRIAQRLPLVGHTCLVNAGYVIGVWGNMQRFMERHAQVVLWGIVGFLIAMLVIIASRQGILGVFVLEFASAVENAIANFIDRNWPALDYSARIIGATGTLLTAIFGIVKGIHYSERRLPQRLSEFIGRKVADFEKHAAAIVATVAVPSADARYGDPLFFLGPLNRTLDSIGSSRASGSQRPFDDALGDIERDIALAETRLEKLRVLKANLHVVRGAASLARADFNQMDDADLERHHQAAEDDFKFAINNTSTKCHALELSGLLKVRRGHRDGALVDFSRLEAEAGDKFTEARAKRYMAEVYCSRPNPTRGQLNRARTVLNEAREILRSEQTRANPEKLEFARNRMTYAKLQMLIGGSKGPVSNALEHALAELKGAHHADKLRQECLALKRSFEDA